MLDLTILVEQTWELKLFDGSILNIKKPSQQFIMDLMMHEKNLKKNNVSPSVKLDAVIAITARVLNNNTNNREFTVEEIGDMFSLEIASIVLNSYMEFAKEVNSNPN